MAFYRILRGLHSHGGKLYGPRDGKTRLFSEGVTSDVIESETDLVKRFGSEKYSRLTDAEAQERASEPVDELDAMTVEELQAYADENEIDMGGARRKKDMIQALRVNQAAMDGAKGG